MRRFVCLLAVSILCVLMLPAASAAGSRVFPETNQTVRDTLLDFWNGNGGLPVFGLPISDQRSELTHDGRFQVQHFERERLELHPENQAPYQVLLGRLGDDLLQRQGRNWRDEPNSENPLRSMGPCRTFSETGRDVCGPFLHYWNEHGLSDARLDPYARSLALFGLPLTPVKQETNSSGDRVLTQWFERARFEYHPNNPEPGRPQGQVLLGRLGAEAFDPQKPNGGPARYVRQTLSDGRTLEVLEGFKIELLTSTLQRPRLMATDGSNIYVAEMGAGRVLRFAASTRGVIYWDVPQVLGEGFMNPHSIEIVGNNIYVAAEDQVIRASLLEYQSGQPLPWRKIIDLPTGSRDLYGHRTRTLAVGPDNKLYVSIGSSCDLCEENDPRRATIMRFNLDGTGGEVWATGLRNTVGMDFYPGSDQLWGVDNGRNLLGENIPPEELNLIVRGGNFGWPYCYGDRVPNPEFNDLAKCRGTLPPAYMMDAHIAPLGMDFYDGLRFPPTYQNDAIVAIHGSAERAVPAGYNVVRVRFKDGRPVGHEELVRGWLENGKPWGRPAGVLVDHSRGDVIISDDHGGRLYRLSYVGR